MTIKQAKSELMQIYGALSPDKQRAIDTLVNSDMVSRGVFEQVKWERDVAIEQLKELGYGLGEKPKTDVSEYDIDHIWYKGKQYISLNRFLQVKYCDRNICIKNEYNGIGCDECEVTKSQEPKTGHWAHDGSYWKYRFICSECNYRLLDKPTNYCPNCGAKMESEVRND